MIDLHSHILPGVDDGSKSVEQSVATLARMVADGVQAVCLTPHLEASRLSEGPPPAHDEAYAELARRVPTGMRLHRGAEVMLDRPLTPRAVAARRVTLGGSRYLLCEFTRMVSDHAATAALGQVAKAGLVPVLAHPERYVSCSVAAVQRWKVAGAAIQVDANTLFRPTMRGRRARELVAAGLADILAADNHGDARSLADPFRQLVDMGAAEQAALLMIGNPENILADRPLDVVAPYEVSLSFRDRIKDWLGGMSE